MVLAVHPDLTNGGGFEVDWWLQATGKGDPGKGARGLLGFLIHRMVPPGRRGVGVQGSLFAWLGIGMILTHILPRHKAVLTTAGGVDGHGAPAGGREPRATAFCICGGSAAVGAAVAGGRPTRAVPSQCERIFQPPTKLQTSAATQT